MFNITELTYGSPERLGNLPKITQLESRRIEKLWHLPKITQLRCGNT